MPYRWALVLPLLLSGCFIVLDGEEEEDGYGRPDARPPVTDAGPPCFPSGQPVWVRDPYTAECVNFGGNGQDCPAPRALPIPIPPYPACETECNPLEERECLQTPGCRGYYAGEAQRFGACYAAGHTWQDPAIACEAISDASACADREDCSSWHVALPGEFLGCLTERPSMPTPTSCENLDEATCIDYADGCGGDATCAKLFCEPLYEGVGCACSPEGCSCEDWEYVGCRSRSP